MPDGPRYDDDFYAWTQHQAAVLREMPVADNRFDREHVAEEIEDLGKSERDAVRSQMRRIIEHFLKLAHSPARQPRFGWMGSIADARASLATRFRRHCAETSKPCCRGSTKMAGAGRIGAAGSRRDRRGRQFAGDMSLYAR